MCIHRQKHNNATNDQVIARVEIEVRQQPRHDVVLEKSVSSEHRRESLGDEPSAAWRTPCDWRTHSTAEHERRASPWPACYPPSFVQRLRQAKKQIQFQEKKSAPVTKPFSMLRLYHTEEALPLSQL